MKTNKFPKCVAHRGASANYPENTLLAFRKAKEMGADWIEFDVNVTADNVAVVFHDNDTGRVTGKPGDISQKTYSEVKRLDAGSWFNSEYGDLSIPTLREILQLAMDIDLNLNIELKPSPGRENDTVIQTLKRVYEIWPDNRTPPLFSSFSMDTLRLLRKQCSQCQIGLLFDEWNENWDQLARELNAVSIHLNENLITEERAQAIKKQNKYILTYTVNSKDRAQELYKLGVDGVFSDHADLCEQLINRHGLTRSNGG